MKKLLLLTLIVPLLFACTTSDPVTMLSGTADNVEEGYFVLSSRGVKDTVLVNEDKTFEFEFKEISKDDSYYIAFERELVSIHIANGQNVILDFDKSDFKKSSKFSGDGADINNYLLAKSINENVKPGGPEVYSLAYTGYKAWADANMTANKELLAGTVKESENDVFWMTEEANILYGWAQSLEMFPMYHKRYAKVEEVELPDDYESYKEKLDLNKPEYLGSLAYKSYVADVVRAATYEKAKDLENVYMPMFTLETAGEIVSDKKVLDDFSVTYLKGQLSRADLNEMAEAIDLLRANVSDEELMEDFNKEHKDWLELAAGQPGFNFVGKDIEGNDVHFSDFKGKYVYVDVWATWCSPCRGEIPFLKKLEEDYHGRNIVFLSYSIDGDKDAWLEFVPKEELGGVQIIGANAWNSELPKYYKIRGIPRFMLFGPEGEIITVNMTRPSNDKTREKFDSYEDL